MTKYVFVTGGVVSGLGKGITAILYLILDIIGLSIIATILMQNEINKLAA